MVWATYDHILSAVRTWTCPGPQRRTGYSTDVLCVTNLINLTVYVLSQRNRDGGCSPIRWLVQTSRFQVVHLCYRRRHDSHAGQSAGQNGRHHTSTTYFLLTSRTPLLSVGPLITYKVIPLHCAQGSRGLSLFYAEVSRDEGGRLRGIEVQRLKDKLGTRQMPTAELLLDGLPAHRVSDT